MEPLSSGSFLASNFAIKNRRVDAARHADNQDSDDAGFRLHHTLIARLRQGFGALLIATGERLSGTTRPATGPSTGAAP